MFNKKVLVAGVLSLSALASVAPAAFADGHDGNRGGDRQYQAHQSRGDNRAPAFGGQRFDRNNYSYIRDNRFDNSYRYDGYRDGGHDDAGLGLLAGFVVGVLASR